jgi:hypothetical protein
MPGFFARVSTSAAFGRHRMHTGIPLRRLCGTGWAILAAGLLASLMGCVRPNLGDVFATDQHGAVVAESAKVVVYMSDEVDPAIVYYLKIDGQRVGRVFHRTFFAKVIEPGFRAVLAEEYFTGKGVGKAFNPANILTTEAPDIGLPDSLNVRAQTFQSLEVSPGEVIFLRLMKQEGKEFFYACDDTRDTTTMCRGVRFDSAFEVVSEATAGEQLVGRQESL